MAFFLVSPAGGLSGNRRHLSCPGSGTSLDLWTHDDNSGRQKWQFVPVSGTVGVYNIVVHGGTDGGRRLLSCNGDGSVLDLWTTDDASGRQRWVLTMLPNRAYNIRVSGGVSDPNRTYLSCTGDGGKVDLWQRDDASGRQQWVLTPAHGGLASGQPHFNVFAAAGLSSNRNMLSVNGTGTNVDLWNQDDNSGRQKWRFVPVSGAPPGVYNIIVYGGTDGGRNMLSCTGDGNKVDLWTTDDASGRQRWILHALPNGAYNIRVSGGVSSTAKVYLSCTHDGTVVDLYSHDDNSGRQHWLLR